MAHQSVVFTVRTAPGLVQVVLGDMPIILDANTAREVGEALTEGADKAMEKMMEEISNGE